MGITRAEWDAALRAAYGTNQAEGLSIAEIAERTGWSTVQAGRTIRRLVAAGEWEYAGKARRLRVDGVDFPVPVYRPKETP